jgi:hypothetical protein
MFRGNNVDFIEKKQLYERLFGSATPCAFPPPPRPSIFSDYSILVLHPAHLLSDLNVFF